MKIKEIMNKAIAINHDMSLREAAKLMSGRNIGSLIAVKKDEIAGIITEADIVKNVNNLDKKVSNVMSKQVVTIEQNQSLEDAADSLAKNKIKRLPVVDNNDKLVGVITVTDIIAHSEDISEDFFFD